jgi:hypothetical protein
MTRRKKLQEMQEALLQYTVYMTAVKNITEESFNCIVIVIYFIFSVILYYCLHVSLIHVNVSYS